MGRESSACGGGCRPLHRRGLFLRQESEVPPGLRDAARPARGDRRQAGDPHPYERRHAGAARRGQSRVRRGRPRAQALRRCKNKEAVPEDGPCRSVSDWGNYWRCVFFFARVPHSSMLSEKRLVSTSKASVWVLPASSTNSRAPSTLFSSACLANVACFWSRSSAVPVSDQPRTSAEASSIAVRANSTCRLASSWKPCTAS